MDIIPQMFMFERKVLLRKKRGFFCSELVGIVYRGIGIYSSLVDPDEIAPVMLLKPELCGEPLPMVLGNLTYLML